MGMPLVNSHAAPSCFLMKYMGTQQPFCAESEQMRDRWMNALAQNALCLEENVGLQQSAVFGYFNLPTKDDARIPQKDEHEIKNSSAAETNIHNDTSSSHGQESSNVKTAKTDPSKRKDAITIDVWIGVDQKGNPTLYDKLPVPLTNVTEDEHRRQLF